MQSHLFKGHTVHTRQQGAKHRFSYPFFSLFLDLDELDVLDQRHRLLSINRKGLWSYYDADHGWRDGTPAKTWFIEHVKRHLKRDVVTVKLLCFPRLLGFVFNPISIFFGYDRHGTLCAVLYEVFNAYKQQHCYLTAIDSTGESPHQHQFNKEFYVSPYTPMSGTYAMKLQPPADVFNLIIQQKDQANQPVLTATYHGARKPLADARLLTYFMLYFPMSPKVWWRIVWQAGRLLFKGHRFQKPPPAPMRQITITTTPPTQ